MGMMNVTDTGNSDLAPRELAFSTVDVGGIPFGVTKLDRAVGWLISQVTNGQRGSSIRLANAYCVALARSDDSYRQIMSQGGLNLPDGMPVAVMIRLLANRNGLDRSEAGRVRGPSFFEATIDEGRDSNVRHFFLGTTSETLLGLTRQLEKNYPGLKIAGTYAPPFAPLDESFVNDCVERVNDVDVDVVWVGLGTPKQDFLTTLLAERTGKYCVGVGAAFDFAAGTTKQAPRWVQDSGFEWLFRLMTEPRRLWRRYLVGNFQFATAVISNNLLNRR